MKDIAEIIGSDCSSISREIKKRRISGKNNFPECDKKSNKKYLMFFCDPYSSWQKSGIEKNHVFIRYMIPKDLTFDNLTEQNYLDMMNNINSVSRKSLDNKTLYELFKQN